MTPILMTVPHTATHSAQALMEQHFARFYFEELIDKPNPYRFAHVDSERCADARAALDSGEGPLIMTLVDPRQHIASHHKRGKELDARWRQWWVNFWNLEPYAFVLLMDSSCRDKRLTSLGRLLGVEFSADWERRGVWGGKSPPVERGMSAEEALNWLWRFPFQDYGYGDRSRNDL